MNREQRTGRWMFGLILGACLLAYVANVHCLKIGEGMDDGVYVSVGKALATGLGYVRYEDPSHPFETRYPPGLPLAVAGVWRLSGGSLDALHLIPLLFSVAALFLALPVLRARLPARADGSPDTPWLWMLLAMFGLNHFVVPHAGILMAEPTLVFFTLATIVWLDRRVGADNARGGSRGADLAWVCVLALIIALACLFRSAGYLLWPVSVLWLWHRRERRLAVALVLVTALLLSPWLWAQHHRSGVWLGRGYTTAAVRNGELEWSPLLRPVENLVKHGTSHLPAAVLPFLGDRVEALCARYHLSFVPPVAGGFFTLLIIAGGVLYARRRPDPATWMVVGYAGALLFWPYPSARLWLPFLPLLLLYLLTAARRLWGHWPALIWVVAGLALTGSMVRDASLVLHPLRQKTTDVEAVARFIDGHTPPRAVIITPNSAGVGLYAHRALMDPLPTSGFAEDPTPDSEQWLRRTAPYAPAFALVYPLLGADAPVVPAFLSQPPYRLVAQDQALRASLYEIRHGP